MYHLSVNTSHLVLVLYFVCANLICEGSVLVQPPFNICLTESHYVDQMQHKTMVNKSSAIIYVSTFTSSFQVQKYVRRTNRYDAITC